MPRARWDELIRLGLAEIEAYDVGKGMEEHLRARWTLKTTYYWQRVFPAHGEVEIVHHYTPSVGRSVQTLLGSPGSPDGDGLAGYRKTYCLDRGFLDAVHRQRRSAGSEPGAPYAEQRIAYILGTAANWAGPIRNFRVVVDKGAPDNLVSFCGDGVRKIGPTQFEMRKTDFTPEGHLSVLILERHRRVP